MNITEADTAVAAPPRQRIRLDYLDGIRALCALGVMAGHMGVGGFFAETSRPLPLLLRFLASLTLFGPFAVAVFIVLSGYCLMIPVASASGNVLPGGVKSYFFRRARRMLPPYYVALVGSTLLLASGLMRDSQATPFQAAQMNLTPATFLSHVFLVHNLKHDWIFQINGPMWSVATEWDIYLFFPLLLLPILRRSGIGATVVAAYVVGIAPHFLLHRWLDLTSPWYLSLFAIGMTGATVGFSQDPRLTTARNRFPWGGISVVLAALLVVAFAVKPARLPSYPLYFVEPILGLAVTCLLIHCTNGVMRAEGSRAPWILRLLERPPLVACGLFSYSIYLVHAPLLMIALPLLHRASLLPTVKLAVLWLIAGPLILLCCYGFHCLFERPFMPHYARRRSDRTR